MFNLLKDPFIRTRMTSQEVMLLSLPQILEAFSTDSVADFPALRPHQRAAWHMLLAQLGAIARHRCGAPLKTEEDWAAAMENLAPLPAWDLVGQNDDFPAFLQVPVSGIYRTKVLAADALDVLVTSRNHSVKAGKALQADPDCWLFSLVSLQTMEGFLGAGNYGISRMNGGFASRPMMGLAPRGGIGAHVLRDIEVILENREKNCERNGLREDGIDLLWLLPWDGKTSIDFAALAPSYVEICRRVRLGMADGAIFAMTEGSAAARVDASSRSGITGDHWCPVNLKDTKAFTADVRGFDASVVSDLLFAKNGVRKFQLPESMDFRPGDAEMRAVFRVMVRGQGKTEGYHEREIPFRKSTVFALRRDGYDALAGHARDHLQEIDEIASSMRYAVLAYCAGGDADAMKKPSAPLARQVDMLAAPLRRALQIEADARFFDALQDRLEIPGIEIDQMRQLIERSREILAAAMSGFPGTTQRRLKSTSAAERVLRRAFRHGKGRVAPHIEQIFPSEKEVSHDIEATEPV